VVVVGELDGWDMVLERDGPGNAQMGPRVEAVQIGKGE